MANHTPTTIRKITTLVTLIWLEVGNKTGKLALFDSASMNCRQPDFTLMQDMTGKLPKDFR
jgi:hypothetical protein